MNAWLIASAALTLASLAILAVAIARMLNKAIQALASLTDERDN